MPKYCTGLPEFLIILTGTANKVGSPNGKDASQLRLPTTQMAMWHQKYKLYYMGRRETGSLLNIQRIHVYLICRSTPIVACILHDQNWPKKIYTISCWAIRYVGHRLSTQLIIFAFLHMKNGIFGKDILLDPKCENYVTQTDFLHDCKAGHNYHIYDYITSQRRDVIDELW